MQRREDYHLRPIQEKDLEMVLDWRNSDRIHANMFTDHKITQNEHRNWFENLKEQQTNIYLIFEFQQRPVGLVYFTNIDRNNNTCSWGFYLGEKDLPKGTGTLLGIIGIEYAFDKLNIRKLCAKVFAFNETSIYLHKKLGFVEEGKFSKHILKNKCYEDIVFFALFKEDWQNTGSIREKTILFK